MSDKQLKEKAIDIKGKPYVKVADRIIYFNEQHIYGSIVTEMLSPADADTIVIKATVSPDQKRFFTGHSQATWDDGYINKTSALENAETSAVGRALAMMGIGVIESIASVDEINKAETTSKIKDSEQRFESKRISPVNIREFWKEVRKSGWSNEQVTAYLADLGHSQTEHLTVGEYDHALTWARSKPPVPQDLTPLLEESLAMVEAQKAVKTPANAKERVVEAVRRVGDSDPVWKSFWPLCKKHGVSEDDVHIFAKERYGVSSLKELDSIQFGQVIGWVTSQTA